MRKREKEGRAGCDGEHLEPSAWGLRKLEWSSCGLHGLVLSQLKFKKTKKKKKPTKPSHCSKYNTNTLVPKGMSKKNLLYKKHGFWEDIAVNVCHQSTWETESKTIVISRWACVIGQDHLTKTQTQKPIRHTHKQYSSTKTEQNITTFFKWVLTGCVRLWVQFSTLQNNKNR